MTHCKCCLQVAAHLWHLVSVRAELLQHLTALKSYFLLARGDFYQAFLAEVRAPSVLFSGDMHSCTVPEDHVAVLLL